MVNDNNIILESKDVHKSYFIADRVYPILNGISFKVQEGETISIMGISGAGKSTLLYLLAGLDCPTKGNILLKGQDLAQLSSKQRSKMRSLHVGFVFQSYHLFPELDVIENVMLPSMSQSGFSKSSQNIKAKAMTLLDRVGLSERAGHRPTELSGGEQQRAALARALMNDPGIIFADEPTGNLDSETGSQVLHYLFDLVEEKNYTLVMVTHNHEIASQCNRVLLLQEGHLDTLQPQHSGGKKL